MAGRTCRGAGLAPPWGVCVPVWGWVGLGQAEGQFLQCVQCLSPLNYNRDTEVLPRLQGTPKQHVKMTNIECSR